MPKFRRAIVVAPTRTTCENIFAVVDNESLPETLLMRECREQVDAAIANLDQGGFGIVAGTGTGKTVAIREIARRVLGSELVADIVTREHQVTEYTWQCNLVAATPGIVLNWLKSGRITSRDLIIIDEIHQTSDHLELGMAIAKRLGCKFVWMSATVDPETYLEYLSARTVIRCEAFEATRRAKVEVRRDSLLKFLDAEVEAFIQQKRGVAVFVPTRAMAEEVCRDLERFHGLHVEFYHGGESADKLRPFLTGTIIKPFVIVMTNAGASSLNILGLDTVVIVDQMFSEVIRPGGNKTLERMKIDANTLLQMGGRVNGRAVGGKVYILSEYRDNIDYHSLTPVSPSFVLGGDLERVALTCARLGIDARELELIGGLDHQAYDRVVARFVERGLIRPNGELHLTDYGKEVERLPLEPHYAELLIAAQRQEDAALINMVIVVSCIDQLYKLHRGQWNQGTVAVSGSDHLTGYNIVASALREFGYIRPGDGGPQYNLRGNFAGTKGKTPPGEFVAWCDRSGFSRKEIVNILLEMRAVYRQLRMPLAEPTVFETVKFNSPRYFAFVELLAQVQSLDYVQNGCHSSVGVVFGNKTGFSTGTRTMGKIRYFRDKKQYLRAVVEGTDLPASVVEKHAQLRLASFGDYKPDGNRIVLRKVFAGEVLPFTDTMVLVNDAPDSVKPGLPKQFAEFLVSLTIGERYGTASLGPEIEAVLLINRQLFQVAAELNQRVGEKVFNAGTKEGLLAEYLERLCGARSAKEISDPAVLRIADLSHEEVDRVYSLTPNEVTIGAHTLPVHYQRPEYSSGRVPFVVISERMIRMGILGDIPDSGLKLPNGREVEVEVTLGLYYRFADTNIATLRRTIGEAHGHRKFMSWVHRPAITLPDPEDPKSEVPFVSFIYGQCAITGDNLVAYGTVRKSFFPMEGEPLFQAAWFHREEEALRARAEATSIFTSMKTEIRIRREREAAKQAEMAKLDAALEEAKRARDELRALKQHPLWPELLEPTRREVDRMVVATMFPSDLDGLTKYTASAAALKAAISALLEALAKQRAERLGNTPETPQKEEPKEAPATVDTSALGGLFGGSVRVTTRGK